MDTSSKTIPRPLIRINQWVIVLSVLITWISGAYWILLIPLIAGVLGVFFDFNPIMRFAKLFLKKHPSQYIPEDRDEQKFNQILAVIFLFLAVISYSLHWTLLSYVFTTMVALAAFIAILGFCIGCFIRYQWLQYNYKRKQR
jgi:FtsH-binding integral membrane protein